MQKKTNPLTLATLELDRLLYERLRELGIVKNQSHLGRLCGKNNNYFACMRNKGFGLKLGSLAFLSARLAKAASNEQDFERNICVRLALSAIRETMDHKCRLREIELNGL